MTASVNSPKKKGAAAKYVTPSAAIARSAASASQASSMSVYAPRYSGSMFPMFSPTLPVTELGLKNASSAVRLLFAAMAA
jgi:glucose/arabinose dehydrogenase